MRLIQHFIKNNIRETKQFFILEREENMPNSYAVWRKQQSCLAQTLKLFSVNHHEQSY